MKNPLINQRILVDCCFALFVTVGSLGRGGLDIGIKQGAAVRGPTKNFEIGGHLLATHHDEAETYDKYSYDIGTY